MDEMTNDGSVPDGKVCVNDKGELAVTKFAVEPVSPQCCRLSCPMLIEIVSRSGICQVLPRDSASVCS